jgi:hypothetical protein
VRHLAGGLGQVLDVLDQLAVLFAKRFRGAHDDAFPRDL